ncbi:MAG: DsrE family protein [Candidatus Latescibacterota bacterium]|nr:MAG: DsrE family protein [Candidatus Latescibacterota bacterium]
MKVLQVIDTAYRCTIEEQDDPVVWITAVMKGAGGELGVLLRGNAVNYAVKGQDASGLAFGGRKQTQPPKIDQDVQRLAQKGVQVFLVQEDASERGIDAAELVDGVETIPRTGVARLFDDYDQVWHW